MFCKMHAILLYPAVICLKIMCTVDGMQRQPHLISKYLKTVHDRSLTNLIQYIIHKSPHYQPYMTIVVDKASLNKNE
jgi:hypothetical protein